MKSVENYSVIYEDCDIVVLNKRSGLLTASDRYDSQAPRLDLEAEGQFGKLLCVHRIDKDTSGCVIYARTKQSQSFLSAQFERREVEKVYHCLVCGRPLWQTKRIKSKLLTDADSRHRTAENKARGKESLTDFFVIGGCGRYCWIEARPKTGRTHQIRAHLKQLGLGIVCDPLYSANQRPIFLSEIKRSWRGEKESERPLLSRLALHAYSITVNHPESNSRMTFFAPYPKDLDATRKQLKAIYNVDPLDFKARADFSIQTDE